VGCSPIAIYQARSPLAPTEPCATSEIDRAPLKLTSTSLKTPKPALPVGACFRSALFSPGWPPPFAAGGLGGRKAFGSISFHAFWEAR